MGKVIYVNFKKKQTPESKKPQHNIMSYLTQCRDVLIEEDYQEFLTAIIDPKIYAKCDKEIQILVDGYFAQVINK